MFFVSKHFEPEGSHPLLLHFVAEREGFASQVSVSLRHEPEGSRPLLLHFVAEREGFEPSIHFWRIHTFQACSFNHSDTSPLKRR